MSYDFELNEKANRLSPFSIIYQFIRQLPSYGFGIYLAVNGSGENLIYILIGLFIGLFVIPITLLNFYYFKFWIDNKEIRINSGILSKKQRVIPINKIQNVNISQNFIQRILGISKIQLETAGDINAEGVLDSVKTSIAYEIREYIKNYQDNTIEVNHSENTISSDNNLIEDQKDENVLIHMSIKDLLIFGVLRFRPVLIVFVAWIFGMGQQFAPKEINDSIEDLLYNAESYIESINYIEITIYSVILFIIVLLFSWILDILLTINQWWDFKLTIGKNKLFTSHGLFNKKQGTIPLKKLQMIVLFSNYFREKFGYWGLMLETAGLGTIDSRRPETAIPFAKENVVFNFTNELINIQLPIEFNHISRKTIRRAFIRYMIGLCLIGLILYLVDINIYWLFLLVPLLYYGAVLRWQYRGWKIQDRKIIVKQGFFFKKIKIIPIIKIQTLNIKRSFFQRRLNLSTLHIDTAASSGINDASIIDIDEKESFELLKLINNHIHNVI